MTAAGPDGRAGIDVDLVHRLLADQAPQWAHLPLRPVAVDGWDNRTYRLGETMSVRLPTAAGYVAAVAKEHRWLPVLAPLLPLEVPHVLMVGEPGHGYPHPWSVRRWIDGDPVHSGPVDDPRLATDLARFLRVLHGLDHLGGPPAGEHSFFRGAPLDVYADDTRGALIDLAGLVDTIAAQRVWNIALDATFAGAPSWFHGDVARGNLLLREGRLAAVIDFGTSGVGDPACDLVIAWTTFTGGSRATFRDAMGADDAAWARARGWALWKALITAAPEAGSPTAAGVEARRVLSTVLADPVS